MVIIAKDNSECLLINTCVLWNNVFCGGDRKLGYWGRCDCL